MPKLSCLLLTAALILPRPAFAQSEVVTPNDNLVTDGLPPVPAAIAAAARPYSEFRTAAFWDWHPTRREMIIGTRFGDAQQLHRVRSPGGDRTQLTFFPDRSEEHTSELQSQSNLVCRLLLEKKKNN